MSTRKYTILKTVCDLTTDKNPYVNLEQLNSHCKRDITEDDMIRLEIEKCIEISYSASHKIKTKQYSMTFNGRDYVADSKERKALYWFAFIGAVTGIIGVAFLFAPYVVRFLTN